ncbi:MAG: ATP-binding cassette domain-containing protein [Mycoplasma sp.]|nr:ATP-binding cassette domain-containing protein [Mycoplasma sp.]
MIETINLGMSFSDKKLFQNVNLKFTEGNTYGVIGANGVGKSTFLKILSGSLESTSGNVKIEKGKRISVLEQDHFKFNNLDATSVVISGYKELFKIMIEKNALYEKEDFSEEDGERASELEGEFAMLGGYESESEAQKLLSDLNISKDSWNKPLKELKSGEKVKILLARALFGTPDILILDEPTNHLDMQSISWLEKFLANYENTVIVVSHDSDFLDNVCTNIVDIDFGEARLFTGNYSFWKQSSELVLELRKQQNTKKEDQIKKLKSFVAKFSANASKSSQATSRKKTLEKIVIDEIKPSTRKYPYIRFSLNREPGKEILTVDNLSYKNEKNEILFQNLSFKILPGEKLVILGDDDIAKTKLLDILAGVLKPSSGFVKWGSTITHDYFPIDNASLFENDLEILKWLGQWDKEEDEPKLRGFLGRMLFPADSVFKKVKSCSGGEKVRLMMASIMLRDSNALILDQPLDHLDTESIDSVIEGLKEYKSSCIFTTYNKAFANEVANTILHLDEKDSIFFRGKLNEYLNDERIQNEIKK